MEADYQAIIELADEAIICTDADRRISLFNHGAEQMFGYGRAEVLGQPLDLLLPEPAGETHHPGPAKSRHNGRPISHESPRANLRGPKRAEGRHKSGKIFPVQASLFRMHHQSQPGFAAIVRDISLEVAVENHLHDRIRQLEGQNSTLSIEHSRREEAEALLERLLLQSHSLPDPRIPGGPGSGKRLRSRSRYSPDGNSPQEFLEQMPEADFGPQTGPAPA